jgi:hypothetical protein
MVDFVLFIMGFFFIGIPILFIAMGASVAIQNVKIKDEYLDSAGMIDGK